MAYPIRVIGTGPGDKKYIPPVVWEAVEDAELLVGGESALAVFEELDKEKVLIKGELAGVIDIIAKARKTKRVVVLLSGDPGFFSLLPYLKKSFGAESLQVIPGISSLQLACARLGLNWHDMEMVSVHGRGLDCLQGVCCADQLAVLTDDQYTPAAVCSYFLEQGAGFSHVWVLTNLGRPGEEITRTGLKEGAKLDADGYSIVILLREDGCQGVLCESEKGDDPSAKIQGLSGEDENGEAVRCAQSAIKEWTDVVTPGLPNELFLHDGAPLSQEEARALVLCKARLCRGMVVYDLGAGSGGWTVEAARLVAPGRVYGVERDHASAGIARRNLKRMGITNAQIVIGEAPDVCKEFPQADCILVGGSGGRLKEIIDFAASVLAPGKRIVLSAVTPDTFSAAWETLRGNHWEQLDVVLTQTSRVVSRGEARLFQGENPIFILSAVRRKGDVS